MSQVRAMFVRIFKELLRDKVLLFWSIFFPIIYLLVANFIFLANALPDEAASGKAFFTLSMVVYAIMIAGVVDLPAYIAHDRTRGMLTKLKSMAVSQTQDFVGRLIAFLAFSLTAIIAVLVIGFLLGARFSFNATSLAQSLAFFALPIVAASGIGLIIGTLIYSEQGAVYSGIGISLITAFISGIFNPYSGLPAALQTFSKLYPISSSNYSLVYLLVGEKMAGYNPLELGQIVVTVTSSILLFGVGLAVYTKFSWKRE